LATRRQLHASYNVAEAIHYAQVDAVEIPYRQQFDLIVLKSVLGGVRMLPNKQTLQRVVDGIYQALRPGGQFLFAENTNASLLHQYFRGKLGRHQSWRYVSVDEIREFLREYSSFELRTAGVAATFGRTEGQRTVLSNLDSLVLERICPPSWRYLAYGVATK
jgi:SAM-dependent methyltransferase